jgi:hypothetical protein
MALLEDALDARGGLDRWRRLRRFTAHVSMDGALFARKGKARLLKNIVVEGCTRRQSLQITGFTAPDRRGLYDPDRVAVENSDGQLLEERRNPRLAFAGHSDQTPWDDLHLAYYCGYLTWNYLVTPFLFTGESFLTEELSPWRENEETWRRLKVVFPPHIATHCTEQVFYFDESGHERRVDYEAAILGGLRISQYSSAYQSFSGILIPTLCRSRVVGRNGATAKGRVVFDIEVFDALFE